MIDQRPPPRDDISPMVMDVLNSAFLGYLWLLASISIPANDFPEWHLLPAIGRMEGREYRKNEKKK